MDLFNVASRSLEESKEQTKLPLTQFHAENPNMADLISVKESDNIGCEYQGSSLIPVGGSNFNVYESVLKAQKQSREADINSAKNKDKEICEDQNKILNSNYVSLDCKVKCFVCGELVEKQKLSGHLIFGELKCSHCFLEVKTCDQFQSVKSYQATFHHNRTSYQHNQTFCQHKDFVWPISPTPIDFLKGNLSSEMSNINVEVCCYIAKLGLLASAKPWKVVIQSYWQFKGNKSCVYCKKSKQNFTLKAILSRPFKPNLSKNKNNVINSRMDSNKKYKNLLTKEVQTYLNLPSTPSIESQKPEKNSLLKSILDQPVRYNFDIINNIHTSIKCNIQDNSVSSSQTQILLV